MIKKISQARAMLAVIMSTLLLLASLALSSQEAAAQAGRINVKDYGAKGDNVTDDTVALQAAFDAQKIYPNGAIYFPAGDYIVKNTLHAYAPNVLGDGNVRIRQQAADKDIFKFEFAWRGRISGLAFYGGAKQLNLRNIRVDQGLLTVENCSFNDSSDFALYMEPRSEPMHWIIRNCHFVMCNQVLHTVCDWTTMSDCWITTARMQDKAAIEARGDKLLCENIVGVPVVTGNNDRWIDNYSNLTLRNFRFGGEFGGMTPVVNFAPLNKTMMGRSIIMEDCSVYTQSRRRAAVYLEGIPNLLTIRDCYLGAPPIALSPKIDVKAALAHTPVGLISYDIQNNVSLYTLDKPVKDFLRAIENRDTSPEKLIGQLNLAQTKKLLEGVKAKVLQGSLKTQVAATAGGHVQKTAPGSYRDLATASVSWDLDGMMDSTPIKNSEYIAAAPVDNAWVFMRRAPNGPGGAWPNAELKGVEIDLDRTPWITWKQRDPGAHPRPVGAAPRNAAEALDKGITMPMGYALQLIDEQTQQNAHLIEIHMPPWFDYGAMDLRKLFNIGGGKRTFTIKYYPLGTYVTGLAGSGFALPGDYQILDFVRAEAD